MHVAFIIFVFMDQVTKVLTASRDFFVLGIHIHPVKNYALPFGLDFGTLANFVTLFIIYIIAGFLMFRVKDGGKWFNAGRSMFLAGAASNLADRLIYGYVRDFIDLQMGFVFNLADVFIVVGLALMLLLQSKKPTAVDNFPPTVETQQK
jgi:signal peptidase II